MSLRTIHLIILLPLLAAFFSAHLQEMTGEEIIKRIEDLMRSDRAYSELSMEIITPDWQRTIVMRSFDDVVGDRSFMHILSPARDKNTTFLRIERNLWMYLPRAERTIRIPPSMMMNSWMGSDFTNDDLVKESSYVTDYEHQLLGTEELQGSLCYKIRMVPKPDAPVSWGHVDIWVSIEPLVPIKYEYYNQRNELRKTMLMSDIREIDGHLMPTEWTMLTVDKPGNKTIIRISKMEFDAEIPERVFKKENLRNPR